MDFKVIGVEFDGTLCENKWPDIGEPNEEIIKYLKEQKRGGTKLVLLICRTNDELANAVAWCKEHGLEFDSVNENIPGPFTFFGTVTRKVFADEYIDDRMSTRFRLPFWRRKRG